MIQPHTILQRVITALETLSAAGEPHQGLFPSIIHRHDGTQLAEMPPHIPGQRPSDRSFRGSNLMHDQVTLLTMRALGPRHPHLATAADRYLQRFAEHCTNTVSGLFPWGEHSFWHLDRDAVGNSYEYRVGSTMTHPTHDHLRATPRWLWEALQQLNPACVQRFADGLNNHWIPPRPDHGIPQREYIRHGFIMKIEPWSHGPSISSCDFPRHGGFYIFDWAFAYAQQPRPELLTQIRDMLDYWWTKRRPDGLLLIESRTTPDHSHAGMIGVAQTLSLGTSLGDAAALLRPTQPALADTLAQRGQAYREAFFAAPHDLTQGHFYICWHETSESGNRRAPIWGSVYGHTPASYLGLNVLYDYTQSQDERCLNFARAVGQHYLNTPMPAGVQFPAMDSGMALGLLADLYALTGEVAWRDGGLELAEKLLDVYFDEQPLPRSAAGWDWYDSQHGPGFLLHGLARIALLTEDPTHCPLPADYTGR